MPVFLLEKVVYLRNLLSMNSILILTRPLVFLPAGGPSPPPLLEPRPATPLSPMTGLTSCIDPSSSSLEAPPEGLIISRPADSGLRLSPA